MPRQRLVFPRSEVIHIWAHKGQPEARNPSDNCSFSSDVLRSYRTPIARHAKNRYGHPCVLVTDINHSVTTNSQLRDVRSATRHMTTFIVPEFMSDPKAIRAKYARLLQRAVDSMTEARNYISRNNRRAAAQRIVDNANSFCTFFRLKSFTSLPSETDEIKAYTDKQRAALSKRQAAALKKRAADSKKREAAFKVRQTQALLDVERWKNGESVYLDRPALSWDYMRISGNDVQTSQGATVPIDHVRKIAPLMLRLVASEQAWIPPHDIRLGFYRLNRVNHEGTVYVGCHTFERSEIERIGALILALPEGLAEIDATIDAALQTAIV